MWLLLQVLLTCAYLASLAFGAVILNFVFVAVALGIREIAVALRTPPATTNLRCVYSSPRARAGASYQPPDRAPAPAGRTLTIEPVRPVQQEWWLR